MRLRLLRKFVFLDMTQYQYVTQSWFKYFQSRNFYVKNARSGSITGKVNKIMEKVK